MASRFTSDFGNFTARLMQVHGRIVRTINDQLEIEAREIMRIAKEMAPREFGAIEEAIKIESARQRRQWIVYVDEATRRKGPPNTRKGRGTVGEYLAYVHDGTYQLGEESREKQRTTRFRVGPKFMERALQSAIRRGTYRRLEDSARRAVQMGARI